MSHSGLYQYGEVPHCGSIQMSKWLSRGKAGMRESVGEIKEGVAIYTLQRSFLVLPR